MKARMLAAAALFVFALASVETQTERRVPPAREPLAAAQGTPAVPGAQAVVNRYCVTCHNARMRTGGLALEGLDVAQAGQPGARRGRRWCGSSAPA